MGPQQNRCGMSNAYVYASHGIPPASMGPQQNRCGMRTAVLPSSHTYSFNGAATKSLRNEQTAWTVISTYSGCFNGAATKSLRNGHHGFVWANPIVASMGPQQNRCGMDKRKYKWIGDRYGFNGAATKSLRNAISLDNPKVTEDQASMGPQQNRCGMALAVPVLSTGGGASMGPQQNRCGMLLWPYAGYVLIYGFNGAATKSLRNGLSGPYRPSAQAQLQWGRNKIVAE